jgi:hypothetical protein
MGLAVGFGLCVASGVSRADHHEKGGMAIPKPAAELDQLKQMAGSQNCNGKMFASPMGPEGPMKGKITIKADLGGHFYAMRWDGAKSKTMPAMSAACWWGYDAAKKMFTESCVDSMGGTGTGTSKGWEGDKWVWDEDMTMGPQKMKGKTTVTKGKGKEVKVTSEMTGPDGKSMPIWETTCK